MMREPDRTGAQKTEFKNTFLPILVQQFSLYQIKQN